MSNFPDFADYNYQIQRELAHNPIGGRVTYHAIHLVTGEQVVIKHFQFAQSPTGWSGYEAIEREMCLLQQLNHPNIPCYLESFETSAGFCLVQEYKDAVSLKTPYFFTLPEIKKIAMGILEILVYLQQQSPKVIHRDIKPENILIERQGDSFQIFLVDFGLAIQPEDQTVSHHLQGTVGFIPPEQLLNHPLTTASDLYSLGVTLICLLTQTPSEKVGQLIDSHHQVHFIKALPHLEPSLLRWLKKMVEPNPHLRFHNAAIALQELTHPSPLLENTPSFFPIPISKFNSHKREIPIALTILTGLTVLNLLMLFGRHPLDIIPQGTQSFAENKKNLLQQVLLETRQCPQCDLSKTYFHYAQLEQANLFKAQLGKTTLNHAILVQSDLRGAILADASLNQANLTEANLGYAFLGNAKLEQANLRAANLWHTNGSQAHLFRANLTKANLTQATFVGANLEQGNLQNANLYQANFTQANLSEAILSYSNLEQANLTQVNLESSQLKETILRKAILSDSILKNANLRSANLEAANLEAADLENADLHQVNLRGAILNEAQLAQAYLPEANLQNAQLNNANLRGVNLRNANLQNANLTGSNLRGANLLKANLQGTNLLNADLQGATLPDGTIHP